MSVVGVVPDATEAANIDALLKDFRDNPLPPGSPQITNLLSKCSEFLYSTQYPNTPPQSPHWFCSKTPPVVQEAATFLLMLHAFLKANEWKEKVNQVLKGCADCVNGYLRARVRFHECYLLAPSPEKLRNFNRAIDDFWAEKVVQIIKRSGTAQNDTLNTAPSPIVYFTLADYRIFQHPQVESLFLDRVPTEVFHDWPMEPPSAIFLLMAHKDDAGRSWGERQARKHVTLKSLSTSTMHYVVLSALVDQLHSGDQSVGGSSTRRQNDQSGLVNMTNIFHPPRLWEAFPMICKLSFAPSALATLRDLQGLDLPLLIMGHLHDQGSHFPHVLRCFVLLLETYGDSLWAPFPPDFPQVKVDALHDNPVFEKLLKDEPQTEHLQWYSAYLLSVWNMPVFNDALLKMMAFLCEDLQNPRHQLPVRSLAMSVVASILHALYEKATSESSSRQIQVLTRAVSAHAKVLASVTFGRQFKDQAWKLARVQLRSFFTTAFLCDVNEADRLVRRLGAITRAGSSAQRSDLGRTRFAFHQELWEGVYSNLSTEDEEAMVFLLHVLAAGAHLGPLDSDVYVVHGKTPAHQELRKAYAEDLKMYNATLDVMRKQFGSTVAIFASRPGIPKWLASSEGLVEDIMALMFSPASDLCDGAQEIAMQAYDVTGRDGCLYAYFEKHTAAAFKGMFRALRTVDGSVKAYLEACAISRATVLCLTDTIEALCGRPGGLFFKANFGSSKVFDLPKTSLEMWNIMCQVIASILAQTPSWASHVDTAFMVVWMRDALIFANEMVSQYNVFHDVASDTLRQSLVMASPTKSRGTTDVGQQMIEQLNTVIQSTIKWLKLTDPETLHQTVEVMRVLLECFAKAGAKPPKDCLDRLEKYTTYPKTVTVDMTREQLATLAEAILPFTEGEEGKDSSPTDIKGKSKAIGTANRESSSSGARSRRGPSSPAESEEEDDDVVFIEERPSSSASKKPPNVLQQLMDASRKKSDLSSKPYVVDVTPKVSTSGQKRVVSGPDGTKKGIVKTGSRNASGPTSKLQELRRQARQMQPAMPPVPSKRPQDKLSEPKFEGTRPGAASKIAATSSEKGDGSSDSDSDEEHDKEERGLAGLVKVERRPPQVPKKPERRGIVFIDSGVPNVIKQRNDARERARFAQLRLKPDLTRLHRIILGWDYDHEGDDPPDMASLRLRSVPDSFSSHKEYQAVFEPLLHLECWNQVKKAKEEEKPVETAWLIAQKQYVDTWLDLDITAADPVPQKWYLAETDIVVLRQAGGVGACILAKVKNYRANASGTAASVRCLPPSQELGLHSGTRWTLVKVFSLSTVHREYAGLLSLPYLDLADEILKPRPAKLPVISRDRIQKAVKSFGVNEPQAEAILGAFEIQGFALIQGPPGTGKTSTICGIAGHFLSTRTSGVTAIKPGEGPQKSYPKKLLICAPSNAAIDEVARRLHEGIMDANGKHVVPRVVRIGNESSLNVSVKNISLDSLVDAKMNANPVGGGGGFGDEITSIRQQLDAVNRERSEKLALFRNIENTGADRTALDLQIKDLNAKRSTLNQRLNQTRDRQTDANRAVDAARRRFRQEVLREADIICSTLSGSGHETLEEFDFETVVIDEAAQSVELSSLIPLKYQCQRCILVGDPKQLAPTVLSVTASKYNYQQSMFVRIEKHRPNAVHLLSIQYRMHPSISVLPSKVFYGARIQDGPDMAAKTAKPWHNDPMFPPYQFFNVSGGLEQANGHTLKNAAEAEVALALYNRLATQFSRNGELDRRIGIVTMYRGQMLELKDRFIRRYSTKILGKVDFNTVDGFQGQEKDVIILSCVRAGPGVNSVGFLADTRRMNVALTRSKSSLYVLGHAATLERSDSNWQKIVQDARERRLLKDGVTPSTFTASSLVTTSNTLLKKAKAKMPNQGPSTGTISLLTPRELIAKTTKPTASTSVTVEVSSDAPDTPDPVQEGETGEGRKRKISAELPPRPAPALRSDSEPPSAAESAGPANGGNATGQPAKPPRPRPPPPKAKPLEASLFIPQKRPQKRGPPPNDSAGPSNVKRRLAAELQRKPQ